MKRFQQRELSAEECSASKEIILNSYPPETKNKTHKMVEEFVCDVLFDLHMELRMNGFDPKWLSEPCDQMKDPELHELAMNLNITKGNQDVECPNCGTLVKCPWMSKHLAGCGNSQQSTYSYSSRNSSRVARQRIQQGFKTSYDESKLDDDDKQKKAKPKKRSYKTRKQLSK